jgi:hypothetical protein
LSVGQVSRSTYLNLFHLKKHIAVRRVD